MKTTLRKDLEKMYPEDDKVSLLHYKYMCICVHHIYIDIREEVYHVNVNQAT